MSHLTTELCEKFAGERIAQWEYDLEAKEWAAAGFLPTAFAERARYRLPRACYFSQTGTKEDVLRAWSRITSRLGRRVRLECTIGTSFGKDLETFNPQPADRQKIEMPAARRADPLEDALSAAFNKLFKQSTGPSPDRR